MSITEYVFSRLDKDQFGNLYTELYPSKGKFYISEYLDNISGTENNSGSLCSYNEHNGLVERLYKLIFESETITIGGLRSLHFQIVRVYSRKNIDMDKVNALLREVGK